MLANTQSLYGHYQHRLIEHAQRALSNGFSSDASWGPADLLDLEAIPAPTSPVEPAVPAEPAETDEPHMQIAA